MKKPVCDAKQKDFLLEEVRKLNIGRYEWKGLEMPKRIAAHKRAAEGHLKIVAQWNKQRDKEADRQRFAWDKRLLAAKKAINFGTPEEAMKVVEELQRDYPGTKEE